MNYKMASPTSFTPIVSSFLFPAPTAFRQTLPSCLPCISHITASSHGCYPIHLMILALSLLLATVVSFVTCQLIMPSRPITIMCRQQGLKTQLWFLFKKDTRCFLPFVQRGFMAYMAHPRRLASESFQTERFH